MIGLYFPLIITTKLFFPLKLTFSVSPPKLTFFAKTNIFSNEVKVNVFSDMVSKFKISDGTSWTESVTL